MRTTGCVAMILAGGRGERLGALTHYCAKPAVHFGNDRIIDFTLCNCRNSGIKTIGILSQYLAADLHSYINAEYGCDRRDSDIHTLPPQNEGNLYSGTADAVFQNVGFIDRFNPECVLVLAGDHIYRMDYNRMIAFHEKTGADITVASTPVPISEASRFGIINAEKNGRVYGFEEKPLKPKSNLASMGIYVFKWSALRKYLFADKRNKHTHHDFGKDILPQMLRAGESMYTYEFNGYWRDVGTVSSLWEANMDQLDGAPSDWDTHDSYMRDVPRGLPRGASVHQSIVSGNCSILGKVRHSVIGGEVMVGTGAEVVDSVIMPGAYIGSNVKIHNSVVGTNAAIMDNAVIGTDSGTDFFIDRKVCAKGISLVAPWLYIPGGMRVKSNSHICKEQMDEWSAVTYVTA